MLVLLGCNIGCNIYSSMLFQKAHFIACSAFNMSPPLTTTLSLPLVPHVLVKLPNLFAFFRWARLSSTGESFRGESERERETDPPEPVKAAATGNDWHINSTVRRGQTARRERRGEGGGGQGQPVWRRHLHPATRLGDLATSLRTPDALEPVRLLPERSGLGELETPHTLGFINSDIIFRVVCGCYSNDIVLRPVF